MLAAIVDAAAERPFITGGAEVLDLERAAVAGDRLLVGRCRFEQDLGLEVREEEGVPVLGESAATSGGLAARPGGRDGGINGLVDFENPRSQLGIHIRITFTRRTISSTGMSSP